MDSITSSNLTNNVVETTLAHKLSLLRVSSDWTSKNEKPATTKFGSSPKKMKLWLQPSVHPTVRKEPLQGRKRTKTFAQRSKLSFCKDVMVFEIPSRRDYSPQHKSQIWHSVSEILKIAHRNRVEFEAEGENWEQVVEEQDMYEDIETGERIHPCWIEDDDYSYEEYSSDDDSSDNDEIVAC